MKNINFDHSFEYYSNSELLPHKMKCAIKEVEESIRIAKKTAYIFSKRFNKKITHVIKRNRTGKVVDVVIINNN